MCGGQPAAFKQEEGSQMGELISFQEAREKRQLKTPPNVAALYWALKSSGWGQMLIDMVIAAGQAERFPKS